MEFSIFDFRSINTKEMGLVTAKEVAKAINAEKIWGFRTFSVGF
jgi:hypothetical protein